MLERVVGRMFRSAVRSSYNSNPDEKMTAHQMPHLTPVLEKEARDIEIDNSRHVLLKIATLYADRLLNDICLVVGGVEYPAHRLILCASSEVFQVMLMNPQWNESHESRVVLQETPACAEIFGEFLRYFYTGHIKINNSIIMPVLALADKYNVKDLTILCVEYMRSHIANAAVNSQLVTWFQYTLSLGHHRVASACQSFIKWNFEMVAETSDFGNFNHELLTKLLQQNDLVVNNEKTLYTYVVKWLERQRELLAESNLPEGVAETYMESLVEEAMSNIRFPMMSPRQLAELILAPLTNKYKEFFIDKMAIAMSFHSNQKDRLSVLSKEESGRLLFTPRLYTAEKWSSLLSIDNFTSLPFYHTRSLVFLSQPNFSESPGESTCQWVIDLHPKGVRFQKFFLIGWQGTTEIPETVLSMARLSIMCKGPMEDSILVKIGILIAGIQNDVEHVIHVVEKNHRFTKEEPLCNLNDILPYQDLNHPNVSDSPRSRYLVGETRDTLKIQIVIAPLTEHSSILL